MKTTALARMPQRRTWAGVFVLALLAMPLLPAQAQSDANASQGPDWLSFQEAVEKAEKSGKKVLIDIYAPWCGWCRKMQAEVYTVPELLAYVNAHFEIGRLNLDEHGDEIEFKGYTLNSSELALGLGAEGTPTTVFLDHNGDYITRLPGYHGEEEFMQVLQFIGTDAFREQSYKEFIAQRKGSTQR